jgi:two-component system, response regulator PdtaR
MQAAAPSVLTVEDDPITRADLRLVLEDAGFDVVADARDGVEAVDLAREHRPDVILLDLGLPRLGGIEASHRILAERDVPIVVLTGRSQRLAEQALAAGAASYVLKPFLTNHLVDTVIRALAAHREREYQLRSESLESIESLVALLGYPAEWAVELERSAWAKGHVWRMVDKRSDTE